MTRPENTFDLPDARTIRSSRAFRVTREALWTLFENPVELAAWWGPTGFTNVFETFEFRDGGAWRFTMRGPDGTEYPMNKAFINVEKFKSIVVDHSDPVHGHRLFIAFAATSDGTRLDWTMIFDHADEAEKVRPFVLPANEQNFDRLADRLAARATTRETAPPPPGATP